MSSRCWRTLFAITIYRRENILTSRAALAGVGDPQFVRSLLLARPQDTASKALGETVR